MTNILKLFITKFLIITLILLSSCKTSETISTPESLYLNAFELLQKKDYTLSAEAFEKIDDEFPYTKWAIKGQTMAVYSYYRLQQYEKIIQLTDDFIKLNPASEYVPYMLYMKGLSYFNKIPAIDRSQDFTREASFAFRELIARFRDSQYIDDSKERIKFIDEHLAGSWLSIARYEISDQNYIGAIKYLTDLISRYPNSTQAPEAYYRLAEIYFRLGEKNLSKQIIKILQKKYTNNYWSKDSLKFFK
jgi:outer membrane protein assembly factor BamD